MLNAKEVVFLDSMTGRATTSADDLLVGMLYVDVKKMFEGHYRAIGPILHRRTTTKRQTIKTYLEALEDAVRILTEEITEKMEEKEPRSGAKE